MRCHFIRHGKRDRRIGDPSLTSEGREEAERLAGPLKSKGITRIFSSPLKRTRETAEIIATALNLEITEDARLRERMNWGDVESQSFNEFIAQWERCSRERDYEPCVGDSSIDAGRRIEAFVSDCYLHSAGDSVIGVSHGGVLADFLLNVFSSEELSRISSTFCNDPYGSESIPECSVTTVAYDGKEYRLEAVGAVLSEHGLPAEEGR